MFWLSPKYHFHITARHIKGIHNDRADTISRLHDRSSFIKFLDKNLCPMPISEILLHMSPASQSFLCLGTSPESQTHSLDARVVRMRTSAYAASTRRTYLTYLHSFLKFCSDSNIAPVPISYANLGR